MQRFFIILSAIFSVLIWFSFAAPTVLNPSAEIDWNKVRIFWTNNSNWWSVDINIQDPSTQKWMHFGTAKISDQVFTYNKQWEWDQVIWLIPNDGWDEAKLTIKWTSSSSQTADTNENSNANRTVIPAVPKTGPNGNVIWIILATIAIFSGYIYIKKRADI